MVKRETTNLEELESDKDKASNITVIKRDGREEPYDIAKMRKVVSWACDDTDWMVDELFRDVEFKLYDKIKIVDLYDELIKTAVNKISMLYPDWEKISAKLYLLKIYKDVWQVSDKFYPHLSEVMKKGLQHHIYDRDFVESFSDEELDTLTKAIKQKNDYKFTYKGVHTFFDKYCLNYSKTRKLELPQITYMRVAMFMHHKDKVDRIENIITTYKNISTHKYTLATPIMLNSGTTNAQLSSCVLNAVDDDSVSIMDTMKNLGVYSKFKGGTALDVTRLRAKGSYITGTQGHSSGPVPFIKILESTMKAFNQGGKRPGACCIYYPWWHIDVEDLLVLKSNGGTEENRARGLKYSMKINELLLRKAASNEDVYLFDPKDAESLIGVIGKEFEQAYEELVNKTSIRSKKVSARSLMYKYLKERTETGNVYAFFEENVNIHNMLNRYINSSNLCVEILQSSRPSKAVREELLTKEDNKRSIIKEYEAGEIALCNLASVNLYEYAKLDDEAKDELIYDVMSTMDNSIDIARYPVKEGMNSNKQYRYLGIGVLNYTNYLASKKIVIDTQEALEETHRLFDELSYKILSTSNKLAIERGKYPKFYDSHWADGKVPLDFANPRALALTEYQPDNEKWDKLRESIKKFGVRNALHMAIAPTATSGKAVSATESIEPIVNLFYKEEGTSNVPTLVPNFKKNNKYYKNAFDCDQMKLLEGAAIRQIYLDQSQSLNMYSKRPDSFSELLESHLYAYKLGIKTLYYFKQLKAEDEVDCESCT